MSDQPIPPYKFDRARWSRNDQITGVATVVLFIALFLPWFGVRVGPVDVTASGLSAHGYLYIVLILCLALTGYLFIRAGMAEISSKVPVGHELLVMVVTAVNVVLVLIAFLFKPSGAGIVHFGWRFGSFVALVAALVAVAPLAVPLIQSRRARG